MLTIIAMLVLALACAQGAALGAGAWREWRFQRVMRKRPIDFSGVMHPIDWAAWGIVGVSGALAIGAGALAIGAGVLALARLIG